MANIHSSSYTTGSGRALKTQKKFLNVVAAANPFVYPVIVPSAVIRRLCTLYNQSEEVFCTMHSVVFIFYNIQHILYSVHCKPYSVQRIANSV